MAAGRASGQSRNYESIERSEAGYVSNISNSQLNREAKKASENTPKTAISLTWENVKRLLFKTGNNLGAKSGRLRRSGMVWGLADGAAGTNLVQIEFAERGVARGCAGSLFASAFEFGCTVRNTVLAVA